jgi:hypothetical protein
MFQFATVLIIKRGNLYINLRELSIVQQIGVNQTITGSKD